MTSRMSSVSVLAEFQRLWEQPFATPRLNDFLRNHPELTPREVTDVLLVDQWFRWHNGQPLKAEEYLRDHPAVAADQEHKLDLIYGEFRALRELGREPLPSEFADRFPELRDQLSRQLEVGTWLPLSASGGVKRVSEQAIPVHELPAIDGYKVSSLLGSGGMGDVYLVTELRLERTVALKMLRVDRCVSPSVIQRFENEAHLIARLNHPQVVPIYDVRFDGSCRYFTMKFISGGSLAQHLTRWSETPRDAVALLVKVADAIHYAHQRGILHRDLKPSNVLLDEFGEPYVTDFGLARLIDQDSDLTRSHELIGTPAYMAPEQADAQLGGVTIATDVYGLGAILYSTLTARPLFDASPVFLLLAQVREAAPRPPRMLNAHVPRDLETICLKALSKTPAQRYPTAQAFADDLRRFLDGLPITARPASWFEKSVSWAKRHPAWSATIALVLLASVLFVTELLIHGSELAQVNQKLAGSLSDAKASESRAIAAQQTAQESERTTKLTLYAADMLLADKARRSGDTLQFGNLLARHVPAVASLRDADSSNEQTAHEDYRGFEWHYLSRFASAPRATLPPINGRIHCVNFSRDGRFLATSGDDGKARVFEVATLKEHAVFATTHRDVRSAIFSPDGRTLATTGDDGTVCLWDIESRTPRWQTRAFSGRSWRLVFTADGKSLLNIGNTSMVRLWNVECGSEAGELGELPNGVDSVAVSPDGRWAAAGGRHSWICLWDIASRQKVAQWQSDTSAIHALAFAHTQPVLAAGGADHITTLWDISHPTEPRRVFRDKHLDEIRSLAFSPDDRQLALSDRSGAVRIWTFHVGQASSLTNSGQPSENLLRDVTHTTQNIPAHRGRTESVAFSPDGRQLASGGLDGLVKFWNPSPVSPSRVLLDAPHDQFFDLALSRDGKSLVTAEVARVYLRDPETGDVRQGLTEIPERWMYVAISADGQHIAAASQEGTLLWWNLNSLDSEPQRLTNLTGAAALRFSPVEPLLAVALYTPKALKFFRGGLQSPPQEASFNNCGTIDFSPDGRTFVTNDGEDCILGDVATQTRRHTLVGHLRSLHATTFHPQGNIVATGGSDRQVILWDAKTGTARHTLTGHRGFIQALAFSPDGRSLVSADNQGVAKVWQVTTGQELCDLDLPGGSCNRLLFASDGQTLFSLIGLRQVVVLDVSPLPADE